MTKWYKSEEHLCVKIRVAEDWEKVLPLLLQEKTQRVVTFKAISGYHSVRVYSFTEDNETNIHNYLTEVELLYAQYKPPRALLHKASYDNT